MKSSTLSRIIYEDGQAVTTVQLPSTFMKQYSTLSMYLKVPAMTKTSMVNTYFSSNIWYGDYLMLWAQVPDSIIVKSKKIGSLASVAVAIKNDRKTYNFSFPEPRIQAG